jgi:hypothetical protein
MVKRVNFRLKSPQTPLFQRGASLKHHHEVTSSPFFKRGTEGDFGGTEEDFRGTEGDFGAVKSPQPPFFKGGLPTGITTK